MPSERVPVSHSSGDEAAEEQSITYGLAPQVPKITRGLDSRVH